MRFLAVFAMMVLVLVNFGDVTDAFSKTSGESVENMQGSTAGQGASSLSGTVVESMDSGGYTYISIEKDGKKTWVAVPQMKVTVGKEMSFAPGMVMKNFTSKTLNRTFDALVFSGGPIEAEGGLSPHKSLPGSGAAMKPVTQIEVKKAAGPDAYTVAELHEKSADLDSKNITVRGEVVKVTPSIMGKNWIHLQDGSGTQSKGTNDIILTTQDLPSVGDVVTAKGTLYKDKDFGSGYKYAVIVEETSIQK